MAGATMLIHLLKEFSSKVFVGKVAGIHSLVDETHFVAGTVY
jgi:hypothetical protein